MTLCFAEITAPIGSRRVRLRLLEDAGRWSVEDTLPAGVRLTGEEARDYETAVAQLAAEYRSPLWPGPA